MKPEDIEICRTLGERFIALKTGGTLGPPLGDGGSAVVFPWKTDTGTVALKVYDPKFLSSAAAPAERYRLELQRRLIGHHNEAMVDTLAVEEELDTCFVLMEFFKGDQLKKLLPKIPDGVIEPLLRQLVAAVRYLESFGLVHRDIKPENILVSEDFLQLKLLDLGVVREMSTSEDRPDATDQGNAKPFIATAQYSSPEYLFRLEAPSPELWKALSLYQVGAVLHDLVCKRPLFERAVAADNKYALAMSVMREAPDFSDVSARLSFWASLSARCLVKDGNIRLKLVDWDDFSPPTESAQERLKKALIGRSVKVSSGEAALVQSQVLAKNRISALDTLAEDARKNLVAQYSPRLRIASSTEGEHRATLQLILEGCLLTVSLAIECAWEQGMRDQIGIISIAAVAAEETALAMFSGQRKVVGELFVGADNGPFMDLLLEAVSLVLIKHSELNEIGGATAGLDLVAATWSITC